MYEWRKISQDRRDEVLRLRQQTRVPWHGPPHYTEPGEHSYHLTAACYEHAPYIGFLPERMAAFESALCTVLSEEETRLLAWCVLPNHWHALISTTDLKSVIACVGKLHGKSSFEWNKLEGQVGRKCWHRCADRRIRSDAHRYAVLNYIHQNPVKHGYARRWQDWPFSSASEFIQREGRERAIKLWRKYPVKGMGLGWDD